MNNELFFFVLFKNTNILSLVISFQDILCKPAVFSLVKAGHKSSLMYYRRQTDWPTDSLRGGLDAAERHTDQQTEGETDQQPKVVSSLEGDCICHVDMTVFFLFKVVNTICQLGSTVSLPVY